MRNFAIVLLAALVPLAAFRTAAAQNFDEPRRGRDSLSEGLVGRFDSSAGSGEAASLEARIVVASPELPPVLLLTAKIEAGHHTYSTTQPLGGPLATKIKLEPSPNFRLLGEFRAGTPPRIVHEPAWPTLDIEQYEGEVTWYAPLELTAGVDPAKLQASGSVELQVCTATNCDQLDLAFDAKLAQGERLPAAILAAVTKSTEGLRATSRSAQPAISAAPFQLDASAVKFTGELTPATVRPGESAELKITATLPEGNRIYAYTPRDERIGTKPTLIVIDRASGLVPHRPATDAAVATDDSVPQFGHMQYHEGNVTWTVQLDVPKDARPGDYDIGGLLGYQSCAYRKDGKDVCELPQAIRFDAMLKVADARGNSPAPLHFTASNYSDVSKLATTFATFLDGKWGELKTAQAPPAGPIDDVPSIGATDRYDLSQVQVDNTERSIGHYIALAFVGGLVLNLMPCVLPVISLKVMSFVEQAHKSRAHALALNLWYSAGIIFVFLLLGLLAATIGISWGEQFGSTAFNVTVACIVFAMALSLLGVWEVPIPGFFGSGSVQKAAAKEGALGAFLKGVVTTVLATPCTAPFMAAAVAWAVTQPLHINLLVFTTLGVGMASPYMLIGVYPELLRFLPKPGAWMETFKQISGFVLLATVVFILTFVGPNAVVPTVLLLLGIAVACWLISRTPLTADFRDRMMAWSGAGAIVLVFIAASFGWLYRLSNSAGDPGWQPFSLERLKQVAVDERRTVLVDFSAEWCPSCKLLEQTVLHTKPVEQVISKTGTVTMYGDFTKFPPEIKDTIKVLGANGVPVIAIFPGNDPYKPIVFGGGYTKQGLIDALQRASGRGGASPNRSVAEAAAASSSVN